jgi:hypothetical protein
MVCSYAGMKVIFEYQATNQFGFMETSHQPISPMKVGKQFSPKAHTCVQDCQIFLGTTYQNGKITPHNHKIYQMSIK